MLLAVLGFIIFTCHANAYGVPKLYIPSLPIYRPSPPFLHRHNPKFIPQQKYPEIPKHSFRIPEEGSGEIDSPNSDKSIINLPPISYQVYPLKDNIFTDFSCEGKPEGYYTDRQLKCKYYHRCIPGFHQTFRCPDFMLFDPSLLRCIQSSKAHPCERAPKLYEIEGFLPSNSGLLFSCLGRKPGNYPDVNSNCNMFYKCSGVNKNEIPRVLACPAQFVFDVRDDKCVMPREDFVCTH